MARRGIEDYDSHMKETLEQRVQELEKKVAELSDELSQVKSRKKDPFRSFGVFKDDPDYDSAMRLGAEWRKAQTYEREIAGS
jgi:archaellum component FlaC